MVGGSEGPLEELNLGMACGPDAEWAMRSDVVGFDLDGNEMRRVAGPGEGISLAEAQVLDVEGSSAPRRRRVRLDRFRLQRSDDTGARVAGR